MVVGAHVRLGVMHIKIDDLSGPEIAALLNEHLEDMAAVSPPESRHALDLDGLRQPEITFWTVWDGRGLVGCGALKALDATHAEVKSMRREHIIGEGSRPGSWNISSRRRGNAAFAG